MLKRHDPEGRRRRVIMLFSEGNDKGSEAKSDETLQMLQFDEVVVYAIDVSKLMSGLTRSPRPISETCLRQHSPGGDPLTDQQHHHYYRSDPEQLQRQRIKCSAAGMELDERAVQAASRPSVYPDDWRARLFVAKQSSLEQAMTDLGHELHSQYLLSYTPNNQNEPGFHKIRVEVNRPRLEDQNTSRLLLGRRRSVECGLVDAGSQRHQTSQREAYFFFFGFFVSFLRSILFAIPSSPPFV